MIWGATVSSQTYLQDLLNGQSLSVQEYDVLRGLRERIEHALSPLDGSPRYRYGGSYGNQTIIRERYDLDVVAYWSNDTNYTIKGIYDGVGNQLRKEFTYIRSKTVAWEIQFEGGFHVDVVPGRALDVNFFETNLYRTDTGTTLKTSLKTHIDTVKGSGRRDVIRLMKLWRERRRVPFKKSFLLELMTIYGCNGTPFAELGPQVIAALEYIRDNIETKQILDPANTNNFLSDDISMADKTRIRIAAQASLNASYWSEVFA